MLCGGMGAFVYDIYLFFVVLLQTERKIRDQTEVPSTTEVSAIQSTPDAVDPHTSSPAPKPGQSLCAYSNLTNSS